MRFLLDTNLISEVRHARGALEVKRRFARLDPDDLFVSVIVFGELTNGIERLPRGRRRRELQSWLSEFETEFGDRLLPFDREAARVWGKITAECQSAGAPLGVSDGQIAATAIQHGMVLITRNVKHFHSAGAQLWNIWKDEAP